MYLRTDLFTLIYEATQEKLNVQIGKAPASNDSNVKGLRMSLSLWSTLRGAARK